MWCTCSYRNQIVQTKFSFSVCLSHKMSLQVNNKAQAFGIADYSVDNFLSVFETLRTMKMSNLMRNGG